MALAPVVDSFGNIYVTGATDSFRNATCSSGIGIPCFDVLLLKYDSVGNLVWQKTWGGNQTNLGTSVGVDVNGNVYVTGYTSSFGAGRYDVFLLKFNSTGALQFQQTWGGNGDELGSSLALDHSGNVYVTGYEQSFGNGGLYAFLLKYNQTGTLLWQRIWKTTGSSDGLHLVVDSSGNIYLAGDTYIPSATFEIALVKFTPDGIILWQRSWGRGSDAFGLGDALDSLGNVYVSGFTGGVGNSSNGLALLKYDANGELLWQRILSVVVNDCTASVAVDPFGGVYIGSSSFCPLIIATPGTPYQAIFVKFSSTGTLQWARNWSRVGGQDAAFGVTADSSRNIYLSGFVSEAPPYSWGNPGLAVSVSNGTVRANNGTMVNVVGVITHPLGTVRSVVGNESYSGGRDSFLLKYRDPSVPLSPLSVLEVVFMTSVVAFTRKRRESL